MKENYKKFIKEEKILSLNALMICEISCTFAPKYKRKGHRDEGIADTDGHCLA